MCCGKCSAWLSGAQNLCSNWKLLGLDRTERSLSEFVSIPDSQLHEIPESLSDSRAIIAEPLANLVHMFRLAAPPQFCRIVIVCCGTLGTLALLLSKYPGIRDVVVQDVSGLRLQVAREMGYRSSERLLRRGRTELAKSQTGVSSQSWMPPARARHDRPLSTFAGREVPLFCSASRSSGVKSIS